ncbi:MAG: glycosyltransferase family 2 protein, partial [Lentisphaeria bacterium]|nr:glycosyltransferase family 2 protein [Lentisphaeria bacterium]
MKTDLILPFYKPHEGWLNHLLESVAALKQVLNERGSTLRVILANDGSPKSCYPDEALDAIRAVADGFIFSSYDVNHGKGYCLRHAIMQADGDIQIYTDGDFPFGWQCAAEAFDRLNSGADVVMGIRGVDYGNALHSLRKLISKGVRRLNRFLLGMPERYLDTQAGMKAFKGAGKQAFLDTTVDTFLFDTEFI